MKDPILKSGVAKDGLPIRVYGGLHYIKGNSAPYFSIGAEVINPRRRGDKIERCGCLHDEILEVFPEFAPLVALHLSDINGVPTHAAENGLYWAAGVLGGEKPLGQEYHGGSGSSAKDGAECLKILAEHLRVSEKEAMRLVGEINGYYKKGYDHKFYFKAYVENQAPRWMAEAVSAIEKFGLVVYGDPWRAAA